MKGNIGEKGSLSIGDDASVPIGKASLTPVPGSVIPQPRLNECKRRSMILCYIT